MIKLQRLSSGLLTACLGIMLSSTLIFAQATLVVTDNVRQIEFHDQITLVSRTNAIRSSKVVATVSGQVVRINAAEGVRAKRGTPLVTIEPDRFKFALDAKAAEANQARVQSAAAMRNFQRSSGLFNEELVSESIIESDSATALAARERYRQLEAEKKRLAFDLASCTVKAPFSGYTGRKLVDIGEWVSPGTPVFELADPSAIKVTVDLPERYFGQLSIGSTVVISRSSDTSRARVGKVTGISPNAVESTHTFPVFVTVPNSDDYLGGGMLIRATLSLKKKFTSLAVSKDAIVRDGLRTMVYTIEEGKAVRIPVVISSTSGDLVAISANKLAAGSVVIVRGNERIFPGSDVKPVEQGGGADHSAGKQQ